VPSTHLLAPVWAVSTTPAEVSAAHVVRLPSPAPQSIVARWSDAPEAGDGCAQAWALSTTIPAATSEVTMRAGLFSGGW
jgi:hypothetical protein